MKMQEILRTNDFVLLSAIEAFLKSADISYAIFDQHMSILEGSIGVLPRRLMVDMDEAAQAERLLRQAGLWPQ